jgi:phosphopentomutase
MNDGFLYSGITSKSQKKPVRESNQQKKKEDANKLAPSAEVVFAQIAKEKARLGELLSNLVTSEDSVEKVAQHLEAVKLHRLWLMDFESSMKIILRTGRKKQVKDEI